MVPSAHPMNPPSLGTGEELAKPTEATVSNSPTNWKRIGTPKNFPPSHNSAIQLQKVLASAAPRENPKMDKVTPLTDFFPCFNFSDN